MNASIAEMDLGAAAQESLTERTPFALLDQASLTVDDCAKTIFHTEAQVLATASGVMRQVLIDHARSRSTLRRSSGQVWGASSVNVLQLTNDGTSEFIDVLQLDDALKALAAENEELSCLLEMRYFGGLTTAESAHALGLSIQVVSQRFRFAQSWLRHKLKL